MLESNKVHLPIFYTGTFFKHPHGGNICSPQVYLVEVPELLNITIVNIHPQINHKTSDNKYETRFILCQYENDLMS